jgi:GMP synthase-like glutamine amidotransferase
VSGASLGAAVLLRAHHGPGDKDEGWVWVQLRVHAEGQLPTLAEVDDFDGFVIPGSACNVSDNEPWIQPLCAVIRAAHARSKGLFGMCFGHQIIAHALGGCVAAAPPSTSTSCPSSSQRRLRMSGWT